MTKKIRFLTFSRYCNARLSNITHKMDDVGRCYKYPNNAEDGITDGRCCEKQCPLWKKFRNAVEK